MLAFVADGDEDLVGGEFYGLAVLFREEDDLVLFDTGAGDLHAEFEVEPLLLEGAFGDLGDVLVEARAADDRAASRRDGDLAPRRAPRPGHLEADGAGADDDEARGHLVERDGVIRRR